MSSELVRVETDGSCGVLRIERGELNALNEALLVELDRSLQALQDDARVQSIVITGTEDMFMAGADLPFFARCLLQNDYARILRFTRSCHDLLNKIERSSKPVVAWVRGPALGAGFELALACQRIVAGENAKLALPETGLGIYPGMGGTQRLPRRVGVGLAKWLIGTGGTLQAAPAWEIGAIDAVSDAATAGAICSSTEARSSTGELSDRYAALQALFSTRALVEMLDPALPMPENVHCVRAVAQLRAKAPRALAIVDRLVSEGINLPLADGIEAEFAQLEEIFRTVDARAGILSFGKTKVAFQGQ